MASNSFLPEDYLDKRIQRRTNLISILLFTVVMGGVVGAFFVTDRQRLEVKRLQKQVNADYEEAAKRLEQLDELQARKEQMLKKAKVTSALLERVPRSLILSEIVNHMPATLSLTQFELETTAVKAARSSAKTMLEKAQAEKSRKDKAAKAKESAEPEVPPTEVTIRMVGMAPTDVQVAQFMTALGKNDLFKDLNLGFSEEIDFEGSTMRRFKVEVKINQDLDITKLKPAMVKREQLKHNPMGESAVITPVSDRPQ